MGIDMYYDRDRLNEEKFLKLTSTPQEKITNILRLIPKIFVS